jgi:hypothetical protein
LLKERTRAASAAPVVAQEVIEPCSWKTDREVAGTSRRWRLTQAAQPALALRWELLSVVAAASVAEGSAGGRRRERPNNAVTASSSAAREGQIRKSSTTRRSCERRGSRTIRERAQETKDKQRTWGTLHYGNVLNRASCASQRVETASPNARERVALRKLRMQSVKLHYQTHGNVLNLCKCTRRA